MCLVIANNLLWEIALDPTPSPSKTPNTFKNVSRSSFNEVYSPKSLCLFSCIIFLSSESLFLILYSDVVYWAP